MNQAELLSELTDYFMDNIDGDPAVSDVDKDWDDCSVVVQFTDSSRFRVIVEQL